MRLTTRWRAEQAPRRIRSYWMGLKQNDMPFLIVQGMPLQQSLVWMQDCPYAAHWPPPSNAGGGRGGMPQVPLVDPGATWHCRPLQQSAVTVHGPLDGLHSGWQTSWPPGPGTQ